jgi:hypothetical protein
LYEHLSYNSGNNQNLTQGENGYGRTYSAQLPSFFCLSWRYLALFAVKKNFILKGLVYLPAEITSELDLDSDW